MVAARAVPPKKHVRRLDWKKAKFLISCPAMTDSGMNSFEVDDTWHIVHGTPGAGLVPFRCRGGPAATFEEVSFLADCVSFDHDMPAVVRPHAHTRGATRVPVAPLFPTLRREDTLSYYEAVESALSSMTSVRLGTRLLALRYGRSGQLLMHNRLKVLRAERNWTQEGLAKRVGVSRQAINSIETGKYDPSLPLGMRLARLFGRPVEEVFQLEHSPRDPKKLPS